jgi:hypothetical protein
MWQLFSKLLKTWLFFFLTDAQDLTREENERRGKKKEENESLRRSSKGLFRSKILWEKVPVALFVVIW